MFFFLFLFLSFRVFSKTSNITILFLLLKRPIH
jgi:hypothetical protein